MPAPIGTIPQGLLSLMALKQTGANPNFLLETVQPSLDLTMFYAQRLMQDAPGLFPGASASTAALTTAQHGSQAFSGCVVPNNETWLVYACQAFVNTIAAADTLACGVNYIVQGTGVYLLSGVQYDTINARARSFMSQPMTQPVWVPPGATFNAWVVDILTATSITIALFMRAARFLI
jgi:hypothetical protein